MFETMLAFSDSKSSQSNKLNREKDIMRRSSINPFALNNLRGINEEEEPITSNPFQVQTTGLMNKLSVSSNNSENISNPFMNISKKTSNPFVQASNPFQMTNSISNEEPKLPEPVQPLNSVEDEAVNTLLKKLSLKIEVKDNLRNSSQKISPQNLIEEEQKKFQNNENNYKRENVWIN